VIRMFLEQSSCCWVDWILGPHFERGLWDLAGKGEVGSMAAQSPVEWRGDSIVAHVD
jgi:hypothetical protein